MNRVSRVMVSAVAALALSLPLAIATEGTAAAKGKAPKSCLRAISDAESLSTIEADTSTHLSEFFSTLHDAAATASTDGDVLSFVDTLSSASTTLSGQVETATAQIGPLATDFRHQAAKCRAA